MPGHYELKRAGEHYFFTLNAANGDTLLTSELYTTKGGAEYALVIVRKHTEINTSYQRKVAISGALFFTLQPVSGELLATSEMFSSIAARERAIRSALRNGPFAPLRI